MLLLFLSLLVAAGCRSVFAFMQQPIFGKTATGERLAKIKKSPNYKNGSFSNVNPTPQLTEGAGFLSVMKEFLFEKNKRGSPEGYTAL